MQYIPRSKTSYDDAWHDDIRAELTAPVDAAAKNGSYEAIDVLSIYYLSLQLHRRAERLAKPAAIRSAEDDVLAAEKLLRRFATRAANGRRNGRSYPNRLGLEPAFTRTPRTAHARWVDAASIHSTCGGGSFADISTSTGTRRGPLGVSAIR